MSGRSVIKQLHINRLPVPWVIQEEIKSFIFDTVEKSKHKKIMRKICYKFRNATYSREKFSEKQALEKGEVWIVDLTRKITQNNLLRLSEVEKNNQETRFRAKTCKTCGNYMIYKIYRFQYFPNFLGISRLYKHPFKHLYKENELEDGVIKNYKRRIICQCEHHK